jgi:hypothetical protein
LPWMDFAAPVRCCSSAAAAAAAMSGAGSGVLPFRCGFERATAPSPRLTTSRRDTWPRALAWMWVAAAYAELKCPIRSRGVVLAVNAPTGGKHRRPSVLKGHLTRSRRRAKFWRAPRSAPHAYPVKRHRGRGRHVFGHTLPYPYDTLQHIFNTFGCVYVREGGMQELARKVTLTCV